MYIFADKISKGEPIPVFNNGKMKRDFTYIDDIVTGIRLALDKNYNCEVFNLGNHKSEELMYMIELIEKNTGKSALFNLKPMQPGDVPESYADIEKSKSKLSFIPTTNIEIGIQKFIEWFLIYQTNEVK